MGHVVGCGERALLVAETAASTTMARSVAMSRCSALPGGVEVVSVGARRSARAPSVPNEDCSMRLEIMASVIGVSLGFVDAALALALQQALDRAG